MQAGLQVSQVCKWLPLFSLLFKLTSIKMCGAQAGLEVEWVSRWHFGTTYLIVARPGQGYAPAGEPR